MAVVVPVVAVGPGGVKRRAEVRVRLDNPRSTASCLSVWRSKVPAAEAGWWVVSQWGALVVGRWRRL
jgi:hypothetical protein